MVVTVIGESGSGKSEYAENLLGKLSCSGKKNSYGSKMYYIATMKPYGDEAIRRMERHHKLRSGKGFETIECYSDVEKCGICDKCNVLLECMSNLTANEMFDFKRKETDYVYDKICKGIEKLAGISNNLVIVTNDIFADGVKYDNSTMEYIRLLGKINSYLFKISDEVIEIIYSCPVVLKGADKCQL